MKNLRWPAIDQYRIRNAQVAAYYGGHGGKTEGVFAVPSEVDRGTLAVIAASGMGWDHVSVSRQNRCPNWQEMEQIKRMFFKDDETAMQLHVPPTDHINNHNYCLHLWRPLKIDIPRPPGWMVGGDKPSEEELDRYERENA